MSNPDVPLRTRRLWHWIPATVALVLGAYGLYKGISPRQMALALIMAIVSGGLVIGMGRVASKTGLPSQAVRIVEALVAVGMVLGMYRLILAGVFR